MGASAGVMPLDACRIVPRILVVNDVEEIRDGLEYLLVTSGYDVEQARNEQEAVAIAARTGPDLLLVSLGGRPSDMVATGPRIRQRAGLRPDVPVVVFSVPTLAEGEEVVLAHHVYLMRPDHFNQVRRLIARLLMPAH